MSKILEAAVEDRLFRSINKKIQQSFDFWFGGIVRNRYIRSVPVQNNKIFFWSFQGDYACNPKYITEYILRKHEDFEVVWASGNGKNNDASIKSRKEFPEGIKIVEKNSFEFYKELASSKVIVFNGLIFKFHKLHFKKNQILIQTWHGSLGIKRIGKDDKKEDPVWIKAMDSISKQTKYVLSNSKFETNVYRETFWSKNNILELGHARNDVFFENSIFYNDKDLLKKKVYKQYHIDSKKKIILYAPTFRNEKDNRCYNIDYFRLLENVKKKFSGEWVVLVRFHPTAKNWVSKIDAIDGVNVIDVTEYPDMQDLLQITDIGVTDYSSWIYDYVLSKKPGFIFALDIADYNTERGFYYSLYDTPFPVATNNDELEKAVLDFDNDIYQKKIVEFLDDKKCVDDGKSSERIVNFIKEQIKNSK